MFRTSFTSQATKAVVGARRLHASPVARKTVTEKVTEVADKLNKGIGKGLASAIDKGEEVTQSAKETIDTASKQTKQQANVGEAKLKEKGQELKEKGHEAAGTARKVKEDVKRDL
ncbi:hypothetical protein CPC08DRAFT_756839 [Agrocybe pediades]|nr:hypothetical protein CPC08DRAFT_756839 [Agrocybe pediades]